MTVIKIAIAGLDAIAATEALLALPGFSGSFEVSQEPEKEGTLATIATIVGIVGGGMAMGEQIRKWYGEYKAADKPEGQRIEKVLIVTPQVRLLLENATVEDIAKALEPLATSSDATARFAPPRSIEADE